MVLEPDLFMRPGFFYTLSGRTLRATSSDDGLKIMLFVLVS